MNANEIAEETHPNPLVNQFIQSMLPHELKAYHIAKSHLNSTFNIEKSNGFLRWKTKNGF